MQDIVSLVAENPPVFVGVVFVFSLLVGSFLNVVIHRLPIMMHRYEQRVCRAVLEPDAEQEPEEPYNLVVPRSACPGCGHAITALENIPVPLGRNYQMLLQTVPGFTPPRNAHSVPASNSWWPLR